MTQLRGKRVLVTGAGRRVGAAIACALGAAGMRVAVHYQRSADGARATCDAIQAAGGKASMFQADLRDRGQASELVTRVLDEFGGMDMLVASAANFERVSVDDIEQEHWDRALDVNLTAPFLLAHGAREALRESRGNIVFITCISPSSPYPNYLPYTVSKAALQQLMRSLAMELAPEVRVNAVAPGTVMPPAEMSGKALAREVLRIPFGRVGSPNDVADAVLYLAGAAFVTGTEMVVDGGRTLG